MSAQTLLSDKIAFIVKRYNGELIKHYIDYLKYIAKI